MDTEELMLEKVCWQGFLPCAGPTFKQSVPEGLHPVGGTQAAAVHKDLQPM